jgi:hypothetical protein
MNETKRKIKFCSVRQKLPKATLSHGRHLAYSVQVSLKFDNCRSYEYSTSINNTLFNYAVLTVSA